MPLLETESPHVVLLETDLGDMSAVEFVMAARRGDPKTVFLLVEHPDRSTQILKTLQAGFDGYLAAPPALDKLIYEIERHRSRHAGGDVPDVVDRGDMPTTDGPAALGGDAPVDRLGATLLDEVSRLKLELRRVCDELELLHRDGRPEERAIQQQLASLRAEQAQDRAARAELERQTADASLRAAEFSSREAHLQAALEAARVACEQAVGRTLDAELVLEELHMEIQTLRAAVAAAEARAQQAEDERRRDRLRLVEERELGVASPHRTKPGSGQTSR